LIRKTKHILSSHLSLGFISVLVLQLALFPALAEGQPASPQEKQPLGSLNSVGQVYLSDAVAPATATVFTGDTVRTDQSSTATFTMSGKGSFQIASGTQLVFTGNQQYVAELKSGIVVMSSSVGASGINVRVENFAVVAVTTDRQSTAQVQGSADGSFLVRCSEGSIGIVPLAGLISGSFLQAGQSITISPQGELSGLPATVSSTSSPNAPVKAATTSHTTRWVILGVLAAGGAAGAGIAAAESGKGNSQTVSPSSP
jgi:hypothetical protein